MIKATSVGFLFLLLLVPSLQYATVNAAVACSSGNCWTEASPPAFVHLAGYSGFTITYVNGFSTNMTGIVFMVVHNSLGQTVEISTGGLSLAAGANGTAYTVTNGLAPGQYAATFFATATSGYAISSSTNGSFTV